MEGPALSVRRAAVGLTVLALAGFVALPVLAAPSGGGAPAGDPAPLAAASAAPSKAPKPSKGPEVDVSATGTVGVRTDEQGRAEYTLTTGSTVRILSAGPPWYFGDAHPLAPFVSDQVAVTGTSRGDDEIDVATVDGTALREPGRPPWAGGWKAVGERHPGWSQEKADRWKAKAAAKGVACWPPGLCRTPDESTP